MDNEKNKHSFLYKEKGVSANIRANIIPFVIKHEIGFEESTKKNLKEHLECLVGYFKIMYEVKFNKNWKKALEVIFSPVFLQEGDSQNRRFKECYHSALYNLLGIINYQNENFFAA